MFCGPCEDFTFPAGSYCRVNMTNPWGIFWKIMFCVFIFTISFSFHYHIDRKMKGDAVPRPRCSPKKHVVFLKTHKTASSTMQNILFRYAESRNLSVALPTGQLFQFYYPLPFSLDYVEGFEAGQRFDILCSHMRFNPDLVRKVMKGNDTFYFSILRNPVTLMESSFSYYKGESPAFKAAPSLEHFLKEPRKYCDVGNPENYFVRNLMSFDFGYENLIEFSEAYYEKVLRGVENSFHLILISEYFDESMILLKEILCWDIDDVVSFQINKRKAVTAKPLSQGMVQRIKEWNYLDWKLYQHFNRTFWRNVEDVVGLERLRAEVAILRKKRAKLQEDCLQGNGLVEGSKTEDKSLKPWERYVSIMTYNLKPGLDKKNRERCLRYYIPELTYTALLYAKQFPDKPPKNITTS